MQKKDRDCGDNAQRDEDKERDPHANRNAVAQGGYDRAADQASLRRHSGYPDKAFSSFLGVLADFLHSLGNRPLLMRRVLTYRSGVTLVGAESSPAPKHSGLHKLETSIVPILQR
jgi:hypothetical protein